MEHVSDSLGRSVINITRKKKRKSKQDPKNENIPDQQFIPQEQSQIILQWKTEKKKEEHSPTGPYAPVSLEEFFRIHCFLFSLFLLQNRVGEDQKFVIKKDIGRVIE